MKISHEIVLDGNSAIIEIIGPIKGSTAPQSEQYINNLLDEEIINLIIDGKQIDYISSEGIGMLIFLHRKIISRHGCFVLCNIDKEIQSLFSLLGFDRLFLMASNREEALDVVQNCDKYIDTIQEELNHYNQNTNIQVESEGKPINIGFEDSANQNNDIKNDWHNYFDPLVVECDGCKSLIRVVSSGEHCCPKCSREFKVLEDQTIVF